MDELNKKEQENLEEEKVQQEEQNNKEESKETDQDKIIEDLSKMLTDALKNSLSDEDLKNLKDVNASPIHIGKDNGYIFQNYYINLLFYVVISTGLLLLISSISSSIKADAIALCLYSACSSLCFFLINEFLRKKIHMVYMLTFDIFELLIKFGVYIGLYFVLRNVLGISIENVFGAIVIFLTSTICTKYFMRTICMFTATRIKFKK